MAQKYDLYVYSINSACQNGWADIFQFYFMVTCFILRTLSEQEDLPIFKIWPSNCYTTTRITVANQQTFLQTSQNGCTIMIDGHASLQSFKWKVK